MSGSESFGERWSRRKVAQRRGVELAEPVPIEAAPLAVEAPMLVVAPIEEPATVPAADPPPTLADVARLTPAADFRRFVAPDVDSQVKNAALKTLFSDPHFNVMDGLDTYIDDYGRPDPLPLDMLRKMAQSKFLGLFTDEDDDETKAEAPAHENADLQLQPDDAAGCAEPGAGPGEDARRQP